MSEQEPPDFAMLRAVEILANIFERQQPKADAPPPPFDVPIVAFSESLTMAVGVTTRADVERAFGIAFAYPAAGWHTYCVRSSTGMRTFLSLFYSSNALAAVELYTPKTDRAPNLAPRDLHVRLVPGELEVGLPETRIGEQFGRMLVPQAARVSYDSIFEARFPAEAPTPWATAAPSSALRSTS